MNLDDTVIERRSLETGKWGNLLMAVAGVAASFLSHSDALLVDGLYSGVNFVSAILAARIAATVVQPADRRYPFGYDVYEPLYVTFRSLVLLGIMVFAAFGALGKILTYATGGAVPKLEFGPILVYSALMVAICLALAAWHRRNWLQAGKRSEILATESRAAVVDAAISGGVGGGFLAAMLLTGTSLEFLVPVSDSIIVLLLCAVIAKEPLQMFLRSLRQVAGSAAEPEVVQDVRTHLEEFLHERPFELLEVAVMRLGRTHFVVSYVKPEAAVDGVQADALWQELDTAIRDLVGPARTELIVAARPPYGA
jgi:predicted Co/Zn/Cd cation transporter (cation efflux family)